MISLTLCRSTLAALVLAGIGSSATAAQILVPSQYADLQVAINVAQPGDVICIDGGVHGPVTIDKPLSLVGHLNNVPLLQCAQVEHPWWYYYYPVPAITLAGPGTGAVTLAGLEFGGEVVLWQFGGQPEAIQGGGFEELWIVNCEVRPPMQVQGHGDSSTGANAAVRVTVDDLIVSDSTIEGGSPHVGDGWFGPYVFPGGPGIVCSGDVSIYDSWVKGGDGPVDNAYAFEDSHGHGASYFTCFAGQTGPNPGQGGTAVSTPGTLYHAESTLLAGAPAHIQTLAPVSCTYAPLQTVPALSVGATHTFNNAMLPALNMFSQNQTVTLQWTKSVPGPGYLLAGWPAVAPNNIGLMSTYPPYWYKQYSGTGLMSEPYPGANDSFYKGVPISFQVWSRAEGLSRPVIECWQPL